MSSSNQNTLAPEHGIIKVCEGLEETLRVEG